MPKLIAGAIRLVWSAAHRELMLATGLQVLASVGLAVQVLVGRKLLSTFLHVGHPGTSATAVLPALVALAIATALIAVPNTGSSELQRILGEMVSRHAMEGPRCFGRCGPAGVRDASFPRPPATSPGQCRQPPSPNDERAGQHGRVTFRGGRRRRRFAVYPAPFLCAYDRGLYPGVVGHHQGQQSLLRALHRDDRKRPPAVYIQSVLSRREEAKEIRTFDLGNFFRGRWDDLYAWRIARLRKLMHKRIKLGVLGGLIMAALTAGAVGFLALLVASHRLTLAGAGAAAAAIILLGTQLQGVATGAGQLFESSLFIEDFNSFVRSMPLMVSHGKGGGAQPPPNFSILRAENITFTYPSRQAPSLRAASVEVNAGEVVALVGENGSGKTTLAKILAGLYQPDAGRVLWDGIDAGTFDPHLWRDRVAVLFQDYVQYLLSARDNVGVGQWRRFSDSEGIKEAAGRAGVGALFSNLPEGYDALLGPEFFGGVNISGGQWQRVALARAIFRDAPS